MLLRVETSLILKLSHILWFSDNNEVATIIAGTVTATGEGSTIVYASYMDQIVSCAVTCEFENEEESSSGNISEATGDPNIKCALYNPYGYAEDVTIRVGEQFTLRLVDGYLKDVDAQWVVQNSSICTFSQNTVIGVSSGNTTITATYAGKTYTCIVRVI